LDNRFFRINSYEDWKPLPCFFTDGDEDALNTRNYGVGAEDFNRALVIHALFGNGIYISDAFILLEKQARAQIVNHRSLLREMFARGFAQLISLRGVRECANLAEELSGKGDGELPRLRTREPDAYAEIQDAWIEFVEDRFGEEECRVSPYQMHPSGLDAGERRQLAIDPFKVPFRRASNFARLQDYIWRAAKRPAGKSDAPASSEETQGELLADQICWCQDGCKLTGNLQPELLERGSIGPLDSEIRVQPEELLQDLRSYNILSEAILAGIRLFGDPEEAAGVLCDAISPDTGFFEEKARAMKETAENVWLTYSANNDVDLCLDRARERILAYVDTLQSGILCRYYGEHRLAPGFSKLGFRSIREAAISFTF